MELPKLSLAPSWSRPTLECSSSESSDTSSSRKRKAISDSFLENKSLQAHCNIIDLQHSFERLPLDWEQCLDLESGKMYFLNRKTLKKSWDRPTTRNQYHHQYINNQKLDLELNISSKQKTATSTVTNKFIPMKKLEQMKTPAIQAIRKDDRLSISTATIACYSNKQEELTKTSNDNMVAMACMSCHMLVIVSKTSPTCPNCKFVHSIHTPAAQQASSAPARRIPTTTFKPLDTLSLFS